MSGTAGIAMEARHVLKFWYLDSEGPRFPSMLDVWGLFGSLTLGKNLPLMLNIVSGQNPQVQ